MPSTSANELLPSVERIPVPSADEVQETRDLIRSLYEDDYAALDSDERRVELAKKLIGIAADTQVPAERYTLLLEARDLGGTAGAVEIIAQSVDEIAMRFRIVASTMKAEAIVNAVQSIDSPVKKKALGLALLHEADQAVDAEQFDAALEFSNTVARWGKEWTDFELEGLASDFADDIGRRKAIYDSVTPVLADLQSIPTDLALCTTAGKYVCFIRGDWESGLKFLAACDDVALSTLARLDLAQPADVVAQIDVADGWWGVAGEMEPGRLAMNIQSHAAEWYVRSAAKAENLTRLKVQKRIDEFGKLHPERLAAIQSRLGGSMESAPQASRALQSPIKISIEKFGSLKGHKSGYAILCVAISPDGSTLISCCHNEVVLWDMKKLAPLHFLNGHTDWVRAAAFSRDGTKVFTASDDKTVRLWDVTTGRQLSLFHKAAHPVRSVSVSHSGRYVICSTDGQTQVYSSSGEELWTTDGGEGVMSPDERILACVAPRSGRIRLIDTNSQIDIAVLQSHQSVFAIAFSLNGNVLVAAGSDDKSRVKVWDLKTLTPSLFPSARGYCHYAAISPDGRLLVADDSSDIAVLDVISGQKQTSLPDAKEAWDAVFSQDGSTLAATLGKSEEITLFRVHVEEADAADDK